MAKKSSSNEPPLTETQKLQKKVDNFLRVCPRRMDKALKAIRMVGDCTLPSYSYTLEQSNAVTKALRDAVETVMKRFAGKSGKSGGFTLP